MEDTCRGVNCWFYGMMKELRGREPELQDCPFYVELVWTPSGTEGPKTAKVIKDCSNKRSLMWLLERVEPRLTGLQSSNEQARNKTDELVGIFVQGFNRIQSQVRIEVKKDTPLLPQ